MDCEKFDQVLIDALYDELDELNLAAARRHADACPRCHAAWSGLKATRKIGILPLVEAPAGLEDRVVAAAMEAQRNVPWPKRLGRAISWAGSYAMRPQTAMAAILLLMLGSSVIFVRAKPDRSGAPSRVHVTERGEPEPSLRERSPEAPPPEARPLSPVPIAFGDDRMATSLSAGSAAAAPREAASEAEPKMAKGAERSEATSEARRVTEFSTAPGEPPRAATDKGQANSVEQASGGVAAALPPAPAKDAYASAMDLYGAGHYAEAEKAFREVAASSSKNAPLAALFAAKSAEAAFGCGKAAPMYEAAASRYGATTPGAESLWGAANCYKTIGSFEKATVFYNELRKVAGYRDRAEGELLSLRSLQQDRVAARRAVAPAKATAASPPADAPPAAATPVAPARRASERPPPP
jgi:hypothetical protein